jgi:hypothetical protein
MPIPCTAISVLVASPGDVTEERQLVRTTIEGWNTRRAARTGVVFLPLLWELHSVPEQGDRAQTIVNKQVVSRADALIALFWMRLGTPTGLAESGTAEEIKHIRALGKHVAIYFSRKSVNPYSADNDEFERLKAFRTWCCQEGLIREFGNADDLRDGVSALLDELAERWRLRASTAPVLGSNPKTDGSEIAELKSYLSHAKAMWEVEKESDSYKIDDAKRIIRGVADNVLRVSTSLGSAGVLNLEKAKAIAVEGRALERHQVYLDGGESYRSFWAGGDDIFKRINDLVAPF